MNAKLRAIPPTPLAEARAHVAEAETALASAQQAHAHEQQTSPAAAVTRREAELATARATLDALRRTQIAEEMQQAIAHVASLPRRLSPAIAALVELDRQASEIVDQVADEVVAAQDAFDRATELAEQIQSPATVQRQIARPGLLQVAYWARIAIARDRARTKRDLANGWLTAEPEPAWNAADRPAYESALKVIEQMEKK